MKNINISLVRVAASLVLIGCNGGGDVGVAVPAVQRAETFPISAALTNYINTAKFYQVTFAGTASYDLTGTAGHETQSFASSGNGTVSESTAESAFEGGYAFSKSVKKDGVVQVNGENARIGGTITTFFDSNYQPLGSISSGSSGSYCVVSSAYPLPQKAIIGTTGTWYTLNCYTSQAKLIKTGTAQVTYSLGSETPTTALLKISVEARDNDANVVSSGSETLRVTVTGSVSRVAESVSGTASGIKFSYTGTY